MRNKRPGRCYRCNLWCAEGAGHFEKFGDTWRVQHAECAIRFRGQRDPARSMLIAVNLRARAAGTGKRAQRARKALRDEAAAVRYEDF